MKNMLIIFGASCMLLLVILLFDKTSPDSKKSSATTPESEPDPRTATIQLGETMVGNLVKPEQTLIHVIQSPPEQPSQHGEVCFVYFNSAIGSEYVLWQPDLNNRMVVWHSNGLVEIIPSGRSDTWNEGFTPPFCKAGRDETRHKIVRQDLLYPAAQKPHPLPKNSRQNQSY